MKTLIILKSLVKKEKQNWVDAQGLSDYLLDINVLKKMYSTPDLWYPEKPILSRVFGDVVYSRFIEILCTKLSKGGLVIIDSDQEVSDQTLEYAALIFGYTVFYVINPIPQDYLNNSDYEIPYYEPKKKKDLEKDITDYLSCDYKDKNIISSWADVISYWSEYEKKNLIIDCEKDSKVLHISDLHSNIDLYSKAPKFTEYKCIVFHGDYVDGPISGGSRKLLDKILKESTSKKPIIFLEGNHEMRVRKYLGYLGMRGPGKKEIQTFIQKTTPESFLQGTAKEFDDLDPDQAFEYLKKMNTTLQPYCILRYPEHTYYCTHAGYRFRRQFDPRFIGTVIYGNRDMDRFDKQYSELEKRSQYWSVHAHCQYPSGWDPQKYPKVINLDPEDTNEIILGEHIDENWKIWKIQRNSEQK